MDKKRELAGYLNNIDDVYKDLAGEIRTHEKVDGFTFTGKEGDEDHKKIVQGKIKNDINLRFYVCKYYKSAKDKIDAMDDINKALTIYEYLASANFSATFTLIKGCAVIVDMGLSKLCDTQD